MICPKCKAKALAGDEFCVDCGFDLRTAATNCPSCGMPFAAGDVFCGACGTRLVQDRDREGDTKVKTRAKTAIAEKPEKPANEKLPKFSKAKGTILSHKLIKEIASSHEYNNISPLSALNPSEKKKKKVDIPLDSSILDAILKPSKSFYLTARAGNKLYQKILMVKDSTCCRWEDEDGTVLVNREKNPRDFIDYIYSEISKIILDSEKSLVTIKREQILILKAINSFCQALTKTKVKTAFAVYDHLKQFLKADDGLKGRLDELAKDGMVRITGSDNPIITLGAKGQEIIEILENYDTFYTLQVLTEGRDEFPSINLLLKSGRLYMISNPKNDGYVLVRTLNAANLRAVLNWMWTSQIGEKRFD